MNKAYKILSIQEHISHKKAKELIDRGLVSHKGKKITLARAEFPIHSVFNILEIKDTKVIFEDANLLVIDKPAFVESYALASCFKDWVLLHRLDRETSGVILLVKDKSPFHKAAKEAFKKQEVYKEYLALVNGVIAESRLIDKSILTLKKGFAKSRISKEGLSAITQIEPMRVVGKKTLLKVIIKTGRTHQIRVHLKSIGHSIVGDRLYGGQEYKRLMLHANKIKIFDYEFCATLPKEFDCLGCV